MPDQESNEYVAHENALGSLAKVVEQLENSLAKVLSMSDELQGKSDSINPAVDRRSELKQWIDGRTAEIASLENRLRSMLARLDV